MSLADQIKTLETEHADALAQIASLEASNQALSASNKALTDENTVLVAQADQLIRHSNDTRAMAEKLGSDALELLRQSRREAYKPAEVVRFAPKAATAEEVDALLEVSRKEQKVINAAHRVIEADGTISKDAGLGDKTDPMRIYDKRFNDRSSSPEFQEALQSSTPLRAPREIAAEPGEIELPKFLQRDRAYDARLPQTALA